MLFRVCKTDVYRAAFKLEVGSEVVRVSLRVLSGVVHKPRPRDNRRALIAPVQETVEGKPAAAAADLLWGVGHEMRVVVRHGNVADDQRGDKLLGRVDQIKAGDTVVSVEVVAVYGRRQRNKVPLLHAPLLGRAAVAQRLK